MSEESWQRYVPADGVYELWLPPGAELLEDETAAAPGESYLHWSPPFDVGTFFVLRQPAPGYTAADMLALEEQAGREVTVEVDERVDKGGRPAHHLRYRAAETRPREVVADPATGMLSHLPDRRVVEITEYLIWHGEQEAISVGYGIDADAPPDLIATFARMLERFRLLRQP